MNFWKLLDISMIAAMLIAICVLEKKQQQKIRRVLAQSFFVSIACAMPLAFIEMLSVFGVRVLDTDLTVNWAFTPLDFMAFMAAIFLLVLLGGVSKVLLGSNWTDADKSGSQEA